MAWTQDDLDAIEKAIATKELTIRKADGAQVTYRSMDELIKARDLMLPTATESSGSAKPRCSFVQFRRD